MTRVNILVERLIVHGAQTFYPNNVYTVDSDVAEAFVVEGYATIQADDSKVADTQAVFTELEVETSVEKNKGKRKA